MTYYGVIIAVRCRFEVVQMCRVAIVMGEMETLRRWWERLSIVVAHWWAEMGERALVQTNDWVL